MHDEADIVVRSGHGGRGALSFRREKYIPEGGPDGGDGGRGGDVAFIATPHMNTLRTFVRRRTWRAEDGAPGGGDHCAGRAGRDVEIAVPCGTIISLAGSGEIIADMTEPGSRIVVATGGRGGRGNARFKSSTNQTPHQFQPGEPGRELSLHLELKLIADIGIIGFPNAGKSTLLSRLSKATPKIAPYPFTTLEPQLGVLARGDDTVVLADIPGLIEGAADGKGLGHQFLRHVERCQALLHLVDGSEGDVRALEKRVKQIDRELQRFSPELAAKPQLIALTKLDARPGLVRTAAALAKRTGRECLAFSAVSGENLKALSDRLFTFVQRDDP